MEKPSNFVNPWTVGICQAPLSMGFPRHEYWSGLPFSSPGNLPDPGMEPGSPQLQVDSLPSEPCLYQIQILSVAAILNLHCARESSRVSSRKASSMFSARCLDSRIKSIANGKLLYKTGSSIQRSVTT